MAMFKPLYVAQLKMTWKLLAACTLLKPSRVKRAIECLKHLNANGCESELTIAGECRWPGGDSFIRRFVSELGLGKVVRILPAFTQSEAVSLLQQSHVLLHL